MQRTDDERRLRELEARVNNLEAAFARLRSESLGLAAQPETGSERDSEDLEWESICQRTGFRIQ